MKHLEKEQKRFSKMIPEIKTECLGLYTIETKRIRFVLIEEFRLVNSIDVIGFMNYFTQSQYKSIKGHSLKKINRCPFV